MACSSCGRPRQTAAPRITRNTGLPPSQNTTQVEAKGPRVQTAVASNPNAPLRTKI